MQSSIRAYFTGAVVVAAVVGASAHNWLVFFAAALVLLGGSWMAGEIRPLRGKSRER